MIRVCFVCLGNICRSPTAECVMRHLVREAGLSQQILVDSAGTSNYHPGAPPDRRTRVAGKARGIEISGKARQVKHEDYQRFDYLVAMDRDNFEALTLQLPPNCRAKVVMLRAFEKRVPTLADGATAAVELDARHVAAPQRDAPDQAACVPDPYFGDDAGFDEVFDICLNACRGLLAQLQLELAEP